MPGKKRSRIPGKLRYADLEAESKKRGIPISMGGFKRQIALNRIQPDEYENRGYKPSPLFFESRLKHWLSVAPRKKIPIPNGFTTTQAVLVQGRKIYPRLSLQYIQKFLETEFAQHPEKFFGAYTEPHGKQRRLVFPEPVGNEFLERLSQGRLRGLFSRPNARPDKRKIRKTKIQQFVEKKPLPRFNRFVLGVKWKTPLLRYWLSDVLRAQWHPDVPKYVLAFELHVTEEKIDEWIKKGFLKKTKSGQVTLESLRQFFMALHDKNV